MKKIKLVKTVIKEELQADVKVPIYITYDEGRAHQDDAEEGSGEFLHQGTVVVELEVINASFEKPRSPSFFLKHDFEHIDVPKEFMNSQKLFVPVVKFNDGDSYSTIINRFEFGPVFNDLNKLKNWDPNVGTHYKPWQGWPSEDYKEIEYYQFDMTKDGEASLIETKENHSRY